MATTTAANTAETSMDAQFRAMAEEYTGRQIEELNKRTYEYKTPDIKFVEAEIRYVPGQIFTISSADANTYYNGVQWEWTWTQYDGGYAVTAERANDSRIYFDKNGCMYDSPEPCPVCSDDSCKYLVLVYDKEPDIIICKRLGGMYSEASGKLERILDTIPPIKLLTRILKAGKT